MTSKAFEKTLRAFAKRTPFKPFEVELVSGSTFRVEHPEALAFNGGAAVYLNPKGDYALFDHESVATVRDPAPTPRKGKPAGATE